MLIVKFFEDVSIDKIEYDVEALFNYIRLKGDDFDKNVIKEIDEGTFVDHLEFDDRWGVRRGLELLSTGTKAVLCVRYFPDKVINCIECGVNAISFIIQHCREGTIVIYKKEYSFVTGDDDIDVLYDKYHFTSFSELSYYTDNIWPDPPIKEGGNCDEF